MGCMARVFEHPQITQIFLGCMARFFYIHRLHRLRRFFLGGAAGTAGAAGGGGAERRRGQVTLAPPGAPQ